MLYLVLTLAVTVSLLVRAENREARWQIYLFKPTSTLLIIALALLSFQDPAHNEIYSAGILVGLVLSLGGDVALMFQQHQRAFLAGLVLFLLGHIAYTVTFVLVGDVSALDAVSTPVLLVAALLFYRLLASNLGSMRIPVIAYILVISLMISRAVGLLATPAFTELQALTAIGGAVLFYFSDVILAADRFWKPLKYNRYSLFLYFGGQLLLALAAHGSLYAS